MQRSTRQKPTHNGLSQGAGRNVLVLVVRRGRGRVEIGKRHAHFLDVSPEGPVPHQDLQVHLSQDEREGVFMES